ncbi:MAG: hypothetical protein L3J71_06550 [Victivallaceae bacterium]|nr:hypothetical protein [Victivallaceae bacterium]
MEKTNSKFFKESQTPLPFEAIAVIRNPAVSPQQFSLAEIAQKLDFTAKQMLAVYPYCSNLNVDDEITLLDHQVCSDCLPLAIIIFLLHFVFYIT